MYLYQQAAQTLVSHLRAQGLQATADRDIVTLVRNGSQVSITVTDRNAAREVNQEDLRSADPTRIQTALDHVSKTLGLRWKPRVVYRSVEQRRNTLGDNFDDILLRSPMLSRCPNPSRAELEQYGPLVRRIAKSVWCRFRRPLLAFGMEIDDLQTYGLMHLVTALHRYRTGKQEYDEAVIGRYVLQRLMEVVRKVKRKGMQCSADSEVRSWVEVLGCY